MHMHTSIQHAFGTYACMSVLYKKDKFFERSVRTDFWIEEGFFSIKLLYKSVYVAFETIYAKLFKLLKLNRKKAKQNSNRQKKMENMKHLNSSYNKQLKEEDCMQKYSLENNRNQLKQRNGI